MPTKNKMVISQQDWDKARAYFTKNPHHSIMKKGTDGVAIAFYHNPDDGLYGPIYARAGKEAELRIGKGGLGKVKFSQSRDGLNQARKTIPLRTPQELKAFEDEVKALKAFGMLFTANHYVSQTKPYKNGQLNDKGAIVMEYINGKPLSDDYYLGCVLKPQADCERIALQVAEQLRIIHRAGYVHADLKLQNIMQLADKSGVRFIDFGLARKLPAGQTYYTRDDGGWGTLGYRAPEIRDKARYSHASDIYALGYMFEKLGIAKDLRQKMMNADPAKRPTVDTVIAELKKIVPQDAAQAKPVADKVWFDNMKARMENHATIKVARAKTKKKAPVNVQAAVKKAHEKVNQEYDKAVKAVEEFERYWQKMREDAQRRAKESAELEYAAHVRMMKEQDESIAKIVAEREKEHQARLEENRRMQLIWDADRQRAMENAGMLPPRVEAKAPAQPVAAPMVAQPQEQPLAGWATMRRLQLAAKAKDKEALVAPAPAVIQQTPAPVRLRMK